MGAHRDTNSERDKHTQRDRKGQRELQKQRWLERAKERETQNINTHIHSQKVLLTVVFLWQKYELKYKSYSCLSSYSICFSKKTRCFFLFTTSPAIAPRALCKQKLWGEPGGYQPFEGKVTGSSSDKERRREKWKSSLKMKSRCSTSEQSSRLYECHVKL